MKLALLAVRRDRARGRLVSMTAWLACEQGAVRAGPKWSSRPNVVSPDSDHVDTSAGFDEVCRPPAWASPPLLGCLGRRLRRGLRWSLRWACCSVTPSKTAACTALMSQTSPPATAGVSFLFSSGGRANAPPYCQARCPTNALFGTPGMACGRMAACQPRGCDSERPRSRRVLGIRVLRQVGSQRRSCRTPSPGGPWRSAPCVQPST